MNIFLWVLQILLALHTMMGAFWKFSNSEQSVGSLNALPHGVWLSFSIIELLCAICLILPAINKQWGILAPVAASFIAAEMLLFCSLNFFSSQTVYSEIVYWLIVAVISGFLAYGRFVLKPL